jgi:hypothetical protein
MTPVYNFSNSTLPVKDAELGIPSISAYVDEIHEVDMAELQFFAGVALDTGKESNRRIFITKDGKPVYADQKADANHPNSGSIERLGKEPEIYLHKTKNWKTGKNLGTAGDLTPTGKIDRFKPEPSLHGDQTAVPPNR